MKSERMVEIFVRWQGTLIRVEQLGGDHRIVLNGDDPFITVPMEWLGKEKHLLLSTDSLKSTIFLLPTMEVFLNGKKQKASDCNLNLGDEIKIKLGPFQFEMRCCESSIPIMSPFSTMASKIPMPA